MLEHLKVNDTKNLKTNDPGLNTLVASLSSKNGVERREARNGLVSRGREATPLLVVALSDHRMWVRWEAAKALGSIADPESAPALVTSLEDEESGVRWLAAEALAAMGRPGLRTLLQALKNRPESVRLRQGAHHICHEHAAGEMRDLVEPILDALDHADPVEAVPVAAYHVLDRMR